MTPVAGEMRIPYEGEMIGEERDAH